jgi:hypothetical protein
MSAMKVTTGSASSFHQLRRSEICTMYLISPCDFRPQKLALRPTAGPI